MPNIGWRVARIASFALYYTGGLRLFERLDRGPRPSPRCTVLNYHRVASEQPGYHDIAVAPETFRRHVVFLQRRGYRFLSLTAYQQYLLGERELEGDSVVLTFDDGYRDNHSAALPVLREFGATAAVFLCTGPIDAQTALWWDRVSEAVRSMRGAEVRSLRPSGDIPCDVRTIVDHGLKSDRRASGAISAVVDRLKAMPAAERDRVVAALEAAAPSPPRRDLMLTWDLVREMHAAGMEFGAHSVTHPTFARLTPQETRAELAESKQRIESETGAEVTAFAYPYGKDDYFDTGTADALRDVGLKWAYTTENGRDDPGSNPYRLRRNGMRDMPMYVLAVRMAGVFEHPLLARLRAMVEGRVGAAK